MSGHTEDETDRLFLVEFQEGLLTIVPLADVDSFRWPEVEQASTGIFASLSRDPGARILVDMGKLHYCGSALLGLMLRVWKSVSPQGGVLAFCNLHEDVARVLKQTRLDTVWTVYPDRASALAALSGMGNSAANQ